MAILGRGVGREEDPFLGGWIVDADADAERDYDDAENGDGDGDVDARGEERRLRFWWGLVGQLFRSFM